MEREGRYCNGERVTGKEERKKFPLPTFREETREGVVELHVYLSLLMLNEIPHALRRPL